MTTHGPVQTFTLKDPSSPPPHGDPSSPPEQLLSFSSTTLFCSQLYNSSVENDFTENNGVDDTFTFVLTLK